MKINVRYDEERIEKLRLDALNKPITYEEIFYHFNKRFCETFGQMSYPQRYGDAMYHALDHIKISIDDGELIVGKMSPDGLNAVDRAEWDTILKYAVKSRPSPFGQDSHMTIDYDLLLKRGIKGILDDIDVYKSKLSYDEPDDYEKMEFYDSCAKCLRAVVNFSNRYADAAEKLAETASCERAAELKRIAANCRKVPYEPAGNFYEALQSVQFVTFCVSFKPLRPFSVLQYQLGRPDRYLAEYYENDIKNGRLTDYEAQTLLDCLGILINRRIPRGLSSGYMLGGRDKDGNIVSNNLTKLCMRVVSDNRLVYPSVGLCVCPGGNGTYSRQKADIELACEILAKGCSHPAFFNDDVIRRGLVNYGLPDEEACSYIHSTCVEITPIASSNVWVASPYINLLQTLLDILDRGYDDFGELMEAYYNNLSSKVFNGYKRELHNRAERVRYDIDPLLSCFVNDCLKNGKDIERGGARYNWIMPSFVGLANAVDSLNVIKDLVFERKIFDFSQLNEMLKSNFEGYGSERRMINDMVTKYGNDDDGADSLAAGITGFISEHCKKYKAPLNNGKLIPSLFCWIMHDVFGQQTGASPDGRLAGFPLGDGSGPAQGRENKGPTASILSSTKWDHTPFIGGIAVNMKFSKTYMNDDSCGVIKSLVMSYLIRGGFEIQINVTDADVLRKAQKNPEQYRDLVVRIGGYSDYFVSLSPSMQEEVITRTSHCV